MNTKEFKAMLARNGFTQRSFSEKMGISYTSLRNKIAGRTDFNSSEINLAMKLLELNEKQTVAIFFGQ